MRYYSTNKQSPTVDFREATIAGQAPDRGLYFPEKIPVLSSGFLKELDSMDKEEVAFRVIQPYVGDVIPENDLREIVSETVYFEFPLVKVNDDV